MTISPAAGGKKPLKLWKVIGFGLFPDFFAFAPAFVYMFASFIFPKIPKMYHPGPDQIEPASGNDLFISNLTHNLYNISHSLFIFFVIFALLWVIFRRPVWEMSAWLGHILIDIPTHSYKFYPTPFLWPVSNFRVNGYSWANFNFLAIDYTLIILAYLILYLIKKRKARNL